MRVLRRSLLGQLAAPWYRLASLAGCVLSRTRSALTTMGISVTAGAITTIIAGVFLSMCILLFFVKFSFLICWTIFSSYVWAVVFFGALCMTAGPSGNFGDISWVFDALFCRKKKD